MDTRPSLLPLSPLCEESSSDSAAWGGTHTQAYTAPSLPLQVASLQICHSSGFLPDIFPGQLLVTRARHPCLPTGLGVPFQSLKIVQLELSMHAGD